MHSMTVPGYRPSAKRQPDKPPGRLPSIEGGEGALFSGSCSWLDRVGSIIIELHPLAVDVNSIISMIESAGFMYIPAGSVWPGSMDAFSRPVHP